MSVSKQYIDCIKKIQKAAGEGIVEDDFAQEILEEIRAGITTDIDPSMLPDHIRKLGSEIISDIRKQTLREQHKALLHIKRNKELKEIANNLYERTDSAFKLVEGVVAGNDRYTNSVDSVIRSAERQSKSELLIDLEQAGVSDVFRKQTDELDVAKEMVRITNKNIEPTGNTRAEITAQILYGNRQRLLRRLELAGIHITEIEGYIHQSTDPSVLRRNALKSIKEKKKINPKYSLDAKEESFLLWRDEIEPLIDKDKILRGRKYKQNTNILEEALKKIHDNIFTGVHTDIKDLTLLNAYSTGYTKKGISSIEQQHRVLHLKADGDSWFQYNSKYGRRNFRDQFIQDTENLTRLAALAERFGPDYETGYKRFISEVKALSKEKAEAKGRDSFKEVSKLGDKVLDWYWDEVTGRLDVPENVGKAVSWRAYRALNAMSSLGEVVISALVDKPLFQAEARYLGIQHTDALIKQLTFLSKKGDPELLDSVKLMGAGFEGYLGYMSNRLADTIGTVQGRTHQLMEGYINLTGLGAYDRGHRRAFAQLLAGHLGNQSRKDFNDILPELKRAMDAHGFTEKDWNFYRKFSTWVSNDKESVVEGIKYMTPDIIDNASVEEVSKFYKISKSAAERTKIELKNKLASFYDVRSNHAIVTPTGREKALATLGFKAGTHTGEIIRSLFQFKTFPITVMTKVMSRDHGRYGANKFFSLDSEAMQGKFQMLVLAAQMSVGGIIVNAIKDILKGRTPKEIYKEDGTLNVETLMQGALRGGGVGILGDLLLNDYDKYFRNPISSSVGPSLSRISEAFTIATDTLSGEGFDKNAAYRLVKSSTPLINLFYVRPVLNYLFLYSMDEAFSEGIHERRQKAFKKEFGQEYLKTGSLIDLLSPENRLTPLE